MEKNIEVSLLLDFYGELLTPSCRQMAELYYNDDLSLAEVAAETGITRQGVRDRIKRGEKQLFEFEQKLGLLSRFQQLEAGLNDIARKAREISETTNDNDIRALAGDILRQTGELKEKE